MKRLTLEEVIERINKKFPNYDCRFVEYMNTTTPVRLICKEHGEFSQLPKNLFKGIGCTKCSNKFHYTTESFVAKAKLISPEYDYSLVNYINNKTPVKVICKEHKEFTIRPDKLLQGGKCWKCSSNYSLTAEEALAKAKLISPEYDYSLADFSAKRLKLICKRHGEFEIDKLSLLNGNKCFKCSHAVYTTEEFVEKLNLIHGDKYDYSLVEYMNTTTPVRLICKEHGEFETTPQILLKGCGCSNCKDSKGEELIRKILIEKNIEFEPQKKYKDLKDDRNLSYDFYISSKNLLIEYNGIQHYKYIPYFHKTYKNFLLQKHHDWLKRKYARDNKINLLVIPYWENVSAKLTV